MKTSTRRVFLALLAALLLTVQAFAASITSAQTASIEPTSKPTEALSSGDLSLSIQDVEKYWTEERMSKAIPLTPMLDVDPKADPNVAADATEVNVLKPDKVAPAAPVAKDALAPENLGGDEIGALATQITNNQYWPYSTMGKVFFTKSGVNYVCSGTAVNSENKSVVWTAGHCVHGGSGGTWHSNWAFVPSYKDGARPYGTFYANQLWSLNGWINDSNLRYDLGAAVVGTSGGYLLVNRVGGQGIEWNYARNQYFNAFGFPAAYPFNGQRLYVCPSWYQGDDYPSGSGPATMKILCDMTGGSSGGGWMDDWSSTSGGWVDSVNSYKYTNDSSRMYGPYHGDGAANLFNAVRNL